MKECWAKQADAFEDQNWRFEEEKSKLFTAIHSTNADVDLDTDCDLLWHWATVFYAILILEAFQKVLDYPTAGLPDHALVEDQSEDVATDVKFSIWRLEETQTFIGLVSHGANIERQVVYAST